MDLTNKENLISYLKAKGLFTKHSLGQNFLVDQGSLDRILEAAGIEKGDFVIEVGPGLGVLTQKLIQKSAKVLAVEIDERLAAILRADFKNCHNLEVINQDILKLNLFKALEGRENYKVVANIPYYITSKILRLFLETAKKPQKIVLLVQKEVAERICASAGEMSVLAASVQAYGDPKIVDIVRKDSFFPAPKVDSAILEIDNIAFKLSDIFEKDFFRTVKIGFAERRKTLVNNLSSGYRIDKKEASAIIKKVGLEQNIRAQELTISEWEALAKEVTF